MSCKNIKISSTLDRADMREQSEIEKGPSSRMDQNAN